MRRVAFVVLLMFGCAPQRPRSEVVKLDDGSCVRFETVQSEGGCRRDVLPIRVSCVRAEAAIIP